MCALIFGYFIGFILYIFIYTISKIAEYLKDNIYKEKKDFKENKKKR